MEPTWRPLTSRAIVGAIASDAPPAPAGVHVEVIDCRNHPDPLEPLRVLLSRLEARVEPTALWDASNRRLRRAVRRVLLGDADPSSDEQRLVSAIQHAVGLQSTPVAVVLVAVQTADPATLSLLRRAVHNPGWLRLSLLCLFDSVPNEGPAAELADLLDLVDRDDPADRLQASEAEVASVEPWLPQHGLILRAAATVSEGGGFTAVRVGDLLGLDTVDVLEQLQCVVDAGFPLADDGRTGFRMPPEFAGALRTGMLPSLLAAWRRRLAELDAESQPDDEAAVAPTTPVPHAAPREAAPPTEPTPAFTRPAPATATERALAQMVSAAHRAWQDGDIDRGAKLLQQAAAELEGHEDTISATLAVSIYVDLALLIWRRAGTSPEATLQHALTWADRGILAAQRANGPEPIAHALETFAAIAHDIGEPETLNRAMQALTDAVHTLQAHHRDREAATLLNNQASVLVRLGHPVRAAHLLKASREVFARQASTDEVALREVAETDHLLARLPFHAPRRRDREVEALDAALEHAANAEQAYRRLRMPLEVARVLETTGRLRAWAGQPDVAAEALVEALDAQQELGDAVGLARTTDALARILGTHSRAADSMNLLQNSVELNVRVGSPLGLAHNRRTLDSLLRAMGTRAPLLDPLVAQLEEAERRIGRVELPASTPPQP